MDVRATGAQRGAPPPGPQGLSAAEAEDRRRRGEGNVAVSRSSRSYAQILRTNVFSSFNLILFVIGVALLALGRVNDAVVSVGLGLVNAVASSALLFVPWFTGYFGLTEAAEPVFETVLPALVLWFLVLTAAYRFRLLDRALGLEPGDRPAAGR